MDKTDLKYYFEEAARILSRKISPFIYYSQITLPYTWQDANCYWDGDDIRCMRSFPNGDIPYEERYLSSFPMNVSEAANEPSFTATTVESTTSSALRR